LRSPMSDSGVECAPAHGELRRSGRGGVRWPWMIVGVGLALVKANAAADLVHHRTGLIVALAAALAVSVLRTRPVGIALSGAPPLAFALAPGLDGPRHRAWIRRVRTAAGSVRRDRYGAPGSTGSRSERRVLTAPGAHGGTTRDGRLFDVRRGSVKSGASDSDVLSDRDGRYANRFPSAARAADAQAAEARHGP